MLDQVRDLARDGAVGAVIFYALDRLSRDETDTLILAREWRQAGVEMRCATVSLEDSPQGQFLLTMLAAVGKLERAGILERTARGRRQTVRNGKIMKSKSALFGYQHDGKGYQKDELEATVVRDMFYWYCVEGLSLLSIARRLYDAGIPTKCGGRWSAATVRNMLMQEAYTGEYWWNKTMTKERQGSKHHTTPRPRSEWIGPVPTPVLIDREMFEAAQRRLQTNKVDGARRCKTEYLLRGMIDCGQCGRRYAGTKSTNNKGTRTYYRCTGSNGSTLHTHCSYPWVNGRRAEEEVWKWAVAHLTDPKFIESILRGSDEREQARRRRDENDLQGLLKERAVLDEDENQQIDLYSKHAISFDKFMEHKVVRDERARSIDARIGEIEERQAARERALLDIKSAVEIVKAVQRGLPKLTTKLDVPFKDKRALLQALHVKVTSLPNGNVDITGYISVDLLRLAGLDETYEPTADTGNIEASEAVAAAQSIVSRGILLGCVTRSERSEDPRTGSTHCDF